MNLKEILLSMLLLTSIQIKCMEEEEFCESDSVTKYEDEFSDYDFMTESEDEFSYYDIKAMIGDGVELTIETSNGNNLQGEDLGEFELLNFPDEILLPILNYTLGQDNINFDGLKCIDAVKKLLHYVYVRPYIELQKILSICKNFNDLSELLKETANDTHNKYQNCKQILAEKFASEYLCLTQNELNTKLEEAFKGLRGRKTSNK